MQRILRVGDPLLYERLFLDLPLVSAPNMFADLLPVKRPQSL